LAGFSQTAEHPFRRDGERRVSDTVTLWFRNGACAGRSSFAARIVVNGKFTANPIGRILRKFSPD
jgi:hypothetical protein